MRNHLPASPFTRSLYALTALFAVTLAEGQAQNPGRNLNVMAVNSAQGSSNGQIYSVTFTPPGGSTSIGNTDETNYVRPQALAFVVNATTNQLDLLVADNQRGTIYRYPGAFAQQTPPNPKTGTLVWNSATQGGPTAPDALAVDGLGNLFVANSTAGHSQMAQLWEIPVSGSSGSFSTTPVLLDNNFQTKETLLEVTLAPTDVAGASGPPGTVSGGDLIVLTTSRVLAYSQASGYTKRITLLSFPNGAPLPGGMDFWPLGNGTGANYSLLISSNASGTISRYYFTSPLTPAPAPFATGLGTLFKIKTLFQAGNPLLFVSQTGAILEFGANPDGTGALMATVTQNVTTPQGLAVSNAFTNAASICLQPGGCNLTGLLTHSLTGVSTLTGDITENVCTVNADPRVVITAGVWSCSVPYTPTGGFTCPQAPSGNPENCLPVNAVCPGFDDTGRMAIPEHICGRSGNSGAGFSLIKTLITPGQTFGGYVQNSAVLADGTNPACGAGPGGSPAADGAFIWAPLLAEGTIIESPSMADSTSGCGSIHSGNDRLSMWGVGFSVNEAAAALVGGGLPRPLENFAQIKYTNLTNTINYLTLADPSQPRWTDNAPNIAQSVSLALWGGNVPPSTSNTPFGCLDQSWLDFYNATQVDADGSTYWTADLQNAANLLAYADPSGATTCNGIVLANNPAGFVQTPSNTYPNGKIEPNPPGELESRLASLYYTINTRILNNPASSNWPLPVNVNASPTTAMMSGSSTLWWNTIGESNCMFGNQALAASGSVQLTPPAAPGLVQYTVSCAGPAANTAYAWVNWVQQPTLTLAPATILQGGNATLTYNTGGSTGCTLSSPGGGKPTPLSPGTASVPVTVSAAGTYTLACPTPTAAVAPVTLTIVQQPTLALAPTTILQGSAAALSWTNAFTGCNVINPDNSVTAVTGSSSTMVSSAGTYTLSCPSPAAAISPVTLNVIPEPTLTLSPTTIVQGTQATLSWTNAFTGCNVTNPDSSVTAVTGSSSTMVSSAGTYTLSCPSPATAIAPVTLTVTAPQPPTVSVSPNSITQGSGSAQLQWTINTGDQQCTASSTDGTFAGPIAMSGSKPVAPAAPGTYAYNLSCVIGGAAQPATLTVNPSMAKIAISVTPVYDLDIGDPGILSWTLSGGASGCVVSGTWPKYSVPQFSAFPVSASGSKTVTWKTAGVYTYTLACTNPSTPVSTSVTITNDR